jgi:uncharacterized protein YndB with AHSA1/START domain
MPDYDPTGENAMSADAKTTHAAGAPTGINERAPVVGASEIDISATPEAVWEVLTAFERWPSWNPDVKSMTVREPVAPGSVFRWKAGPGTIESTIQRVERPRLIAWTGETLGIKAIHFWHLEPRGSSTFVRTEESYVGLVARLFRRPIQKTLDRALADGLRYLKAEVERHPTTEDSRPGSMPPASGSEADGNA